MLELFFFNSKRYKIELIVPNIPWIIKANEINKTAKRSLNTNKKIMIKTPANVNFNIEDNSLNTIFHIPDFFNRDLSSF